MTKSNRKNKNKKSSVSHTEPTNKKMKLSEAENVHNIKNTEFILTDQVIESVKMLEWCAEQGVCVLLSGPVGSGKTALVEYVSCKLKRHLTKLQISDDTDARTLLGGYCCTDIPGQFEWRQGPLLTAMVRGSWLLLEDVACGQSNLLGMLRPLLEATALGLRVSHSGIDAHPAFRLLVTQSLITVAAGYAEPRIACTAYGTNCLSKCQPIVLHSISSQSLAQIITRNYPRLVALLPKLIGDQGLIQWVMRPTQSKLQERVNSARDLFNFCRRITALEPKSDEQINTLYFLDAADCFIQHIHDYDHRISILNYIGSVFNLTHTNVESILNHRITKIVADAVEDSVISVGRVQLKRRTKAIRDFLNPSHHFAQTRQMMQLLESLARCVQMQEPVLLVSETGCGKTSTVQYLSKLVNRKLTVINMNQQSDSSDLLGGYKPVNNAFSDTEMTQLTADMAAMVEQFNIIFKATFSSQQNNVFLVHVKNTQDSNDIEKLINLIGNDVISKAVFAIDSLSESLKTEWTEFYDTINDIKKKMQKLKCNLTFSFIEGALVQAVKNGDWVLLDEINLAPPEMLQSLSGLLESVTGSITLVERGDEIPVPRHADFRLFACMNPATDVGKRNLPQGLRNRFTEIYLHELSSIEELSTIVKHYIGSLTHTVVESLVKFYLALRDDVKTNKMVDGGGSRPQFSLRTLCRALEEIKHVIKNELYRTTMSRALFEGLSFSFKSQLSDDSRALFDRRFEEFFTCQIKTLERGGLISKNVTTEMLSQKGFKLIMGYPIKLGQQYIANIEETDEFVKGYKITKSVSKNLQDLARIISGGKALPVLVQGETSVGKTSMIMYLAKLTGHIYHRINNHESTDIQEYLGCYVNGEGTSGKLVFKEGVLAEAMRKGHWIILDELNLAPTDILEALNRVLDDNRELFIAETQTTITAHPMFRIFATQNPPGLYGGRKVLSRALRNRFIELHFNPIPNEELVDILEECCQMPKSRGIKMVETMRLLQTDSQELDVVHCKRNYISLRDLFRWARRVYFEHNKSNITFDWDRHLIEEGYLLLTGKARSEDEVNLVAKILGKVFKNVNVQLNDEWFFSKSGSNIAKNVLSRCEQVQEIANIEWTHDFRRMAVLLIRAIECDEPTLLVGNTGCGKTTICHLAALLHQRELLSINCHMHTEASDFLGGLRPTTNQNDDEKRLFKWVDGPLVIAMKEGKMFLIDEISLADDSVLERLNSVLESDRKLTLIENGEMSMSSDDNEQSIEIRASKGFQVFATMNPGGDFGKKELSPALKNRFTEIWCPSNSWSTTERGLGDWVSIAARNLHSIDDDNLRNGTANVLVHFLRAVVNISNEIKMSVVSIRDLLSWVEFINLSVKKNLSLYESILHGAYMVIIDSINDKINKDEFVKKLIGILDKNIDLFLRGIRVDMILDVERYELSTFENKIGMSPFFIELGPSPNMNLLQNIVNGTMACNYSFTSKTTGSNLWRLLRALQISKKPLLLEGSPGVGKTSLVTQLAKIAGYKVIRINLSEQTDANDLFGCFLPIENGAAGQLCWRDGPLLQALKNGDWILLDEMNLASQSVLESLNACLDHRGEIFIPELNQTFTVKPGKTRLFACQNPMSEGGGRKGLPKSFVNRFTQVYMSTLLTGDYEEILTCLYPAIQLNTLKFMIQYVQALKEEIVILRRFGTKGSPWEFNLRDLCRWCDLMLTHQTGPYEPSFFVSLLFIDRFRLEVDKEEARKLYNIMAEKSHQASLFTSGLQLHVTEDEIRLGQATLKISNIKRSDPKFLEKNLILNGQLATLESMMLTVNMGWMTILVGPSGAGKTSLVNILASITGNKLQTMSMNSAMDTTDLLGSFEQQKDGGKFKWMDSMLVQALKTGDWLVLDTVNFCNASVLDRLNGLLEPNGTLLLTERGLLDGNQLEEIKPHPNFRIFLVLDPECGGEISKAMRNRGMEIAFIKKEHELCLKDDDILSILIHVHKLSMKDAQAIINFHLLLIDARGNLPQIRAGNVTSMLQVGVLMSRDHTLKQALKSVYGETQMFFSVRDDVNQFIEGIEENEPSDCFLTAMPLSHVINDPVASFVKRDLEVLSQTLKESGPSTTEDNTILARLFLMASSKKDVPLRMEMSLADCNFNQACKHFENILLTYQGKADNLPIDLRHLPNWAEFKDLNYSQENSLLFDLFNLGTNNISTDVADKLKTIKPSQITKDSINSYNVEEISRLFTTGKLSRNMMSRFSGLDEKTGEFIQLIRSVDFAGLCNVDNLYSLRKVCKMIDRFCGTYPGDGVRWLSTYVYHVNALMDEMDFSGPLRDVARKITDKLNKWDLCQEADIVEGDELKHSVVKRMTLRSEYPHSVLINSEEQHSLLVKDMNGSNELSIWKASNEDKLRIVLLKTFAEISGAELNTNTLANNIDTECTKIWPFLFNILSFVLKSFNVDQGQRQLIKFFNDMSHSQFNLPLLPCQLQKRIQRMDTDAEYTLITDWVKYLISQSQFNKILASCHFQVDRETEDYELRFEFPKGFLKPDIPSLWTRPDNAVFLLISGIETKADALSYFNNLKHTDLAKRTLRSVKERKLQLELCKETLLECSALLSTDEFRISNEIETMNKMMDMQRRCLLACNTTDSDDTIWLSTVTPWFLSLERDFNSFKQQDKDTNSLATIGRLWVRWGVVQMKLFAIMEPLDPQTQIYWENLYLSEELALLEREDALSRTYRGIMSGVNQDGIAKHCWSVYGAQHPLLQVTSTRIMELKEKMSKLSANVGLRPVGDDKFTQLRLKTLRFLSKYGWNALCDGTLTSVKEMDKGFIMEWSMAASELLDYMLEQSESIAFPDLVEPFALGVSRTLSGMSMLMADHPNNCQDKKRNSADRIMKMFCQFPNFSSLDVVSNILINENEIMDDIETLMGKCDSKTQGRIHIKLLHLCLRLLLFYKNNDLKAPKNDAQMFKLLHKILSIFETLWKKQEEKRIEKEVTEGTIYINKQKVTENLTDEEVEELEIYLNVSPKNGDLDNMEMSAAMNSAASQIRQFREKLEAMENGLMLTEDTVHSVVHLASEIMCADIQEPDMSVFRDCYRFAAALISCDADNMVSSTQGQLLTSHLAALTWEIEATETGDQLILSERPYDIYQDPVLANDLYAAGTALENLRTRLAGLLATYPDHASLLAIQKKMNSICNLSLEYPLIVFISHVEKLIFEIEQWEIVAARHVSLKASICDLNQLLVSWRHKELKMWSNTLKTASWKMKYNVSLEFFNFYHIMMTEMKIPQLDNNYLSINAIIEPLLISLNTSKVGNYKAKLSMFQLLIASLKTVPTDNESFKTRLINILKNHYDYYHLYLINFEQQLESEYKKIGKELKDFIKTQKWGDIPPKITSVSKCHKIVFKYLRQWNNAIHQPCKPLLILNPFNALKKVNLNAVSTLEMSHDDGQLEIIFPESRLFKWTEEMLLYFRDMWETLESYQRETKEMELRAVEESKETENKEVLEKKWRSHVKNLQQRKRNCVTNFVKYLKELGLKIFGTPFPAGAALVTHLPNGDITGGASSTVRCIGLRLQLDTTDKSEDFAKFNDFKGRLINICDDWLTRVCTNTTRIKKMECGANRLKEATNQLRVSLLGDIISSSAATEIDAKISVIKARNMEILSQWNVFVNKMTQMNNGKRFPSLVPDQLKPTLCSNGRDNDVIGRVLSEIGLSEQLDGYLTTEKHTNAIKKQRETVGLINTLLSSISKQFSVEGSLNRSAVVDHFSNVNRQHDSLVTALESDIQRKSNIPSTELSKMTHLIQITSLSINKSLQKFQEILLDNSENMSFISISEHLESLESVIDHDAIENVLSQVKDSLLRMSGEELSDCRSLINENLVSLLILVVSIDEEYLKVMKNYHEVFVSGLDALLTVTSNLIKDGFCVPDDSAWGEQSEDATGKAEKFNNFEMAGMDEGTGTNDVSDQIESESQLEGTNKDEHKEQPDDQPDVPDQEDGIEMSEDFQAKTHDPEVDNNEKNDQDDKKDELDELEDKMGEVGDAEETDLNKQSWDDKEEEKEEDETDKNDDDRNGGVSKDDTTEVVADNNENKDKEKESQEKKDNKENKNDTEEECEEEAKEDGFAEVNETGEDEDRPEEKPDPALNQPENEPENEEVEENNALDDFFENDEKLNDDEQNEEGPEQIGEIQEEGQEDQPEEETIDGMTPNEEKVDNEMESEQMQQSINIAGGTDAMDAKEEKSYDTEMGETDNNEGSSGNGSSQMKSTNIPSNSGKMDEKLNNDEENKDTENDQADDPKNNTSENRTLGDMDKPFKRKADVMDPEETVDPKKQKTTDAYAHLDSEQGDDGADQILDNATASQQQHIPEANEEEMDISEITENEEKKTGDDNEFGETIENSGQVKEKDKKEKEKTESKLIIDEVKEERLNWSQYEARSDYLARQLCEQLRNVLEPTKSNKLGGAFRTGKRLDMKKVIPYIASGFRKDKIWLRRNKPSQREYQVLIGVDNSKSIKYNVSNNLFFESLSIVLNGLTFLEVGQVGVCKFGSSTEVVLPLHQSFSSEIGENLVKTFDFSDGCSKFIPMLEKAIEMFTDSRHTLSSSASPDTSQLLLLLSDGDISEDVTDPRFTTLIREANNRGIFIVVIVFDHADPLNSILNSKLFIGEGNDYVRYLDVFPIPNYTVLQDVTKLPSLLTDVLSQWFELASSVDKGPSR